jgi:3-oxoacyl-[acyl-carrier protein] reductase
MIDLGGRVAIVTGGSRGIGRAIACKLASQGADIVLSFAGNQAAADDACAEISRLGRQAVGVKADVSRPEDAARLVEAAIAAFGRVDILVNNAGITSDHLIAFMPVSEWARVIDVNLTGALLTTQAVLSSMSAGGWGRIVNVASVAGITGNGGQANYSASKAGLIALTQSTAHEASPHGITCNAVAPGLVLTDLTEELSDTASKAILEQVSMKRAGSLDEVASTVAFLASEEAAYITGQVLAIDGGMSMA